MDKRNYRKTELTKTDRKDRGDNLKKVEKVVKKVLDSVEEIKSQYPGGDSDRKVLKVDKPKVVFSKKSDDVKLKIVEHRASKENLAKKVDELKTNKDERKKIKDKYNLKLKGPVVAPPVKKEDLVKLNVKVPTVEVKYDHPPKKPSELKNKIESFIESTPSDHFKEKRKDTVHRRPLIKTVTAKNDTTKVFKAVTFVDQKDKPTMLQIKIPGDVRNSKKSVETNTIVKRVKATVSRVSVKEKPVVSRRKSNKSKKRERRIHPTSPDLSVKIRSPPTEVAKWAPSSINRHTKPYYEAWVNTTLAAISKNARKDKLFLEKQNVLQSFQRALAERPETPELVYENFTDEKYTGRIKVKQRS